MTAPAFTVVITTYNRAEMLPIAVRSVLAQTCADFELIIVDDGSTDATPDVIRTLGGDDRVRCLRIENSGVSRARNYGIGTGRGEWIALLDDDNEWYPTYLEHQLERAAASPTADVVYCSGEQYAADGRLVWVWPDTNQPADVFAAQVEGWFTWVSATIFRRALFQDVGGFNPALDSREDLDLFRRLALRAEFAGSSEALMIRRLHGHPRASKATLPLIRAGAELDRRWRRTIIERCGYVAYARYFRREISRPIVRAMFLAPEAERRAAAVAAVRSLVSRLPWSATTLPSPLLLAVIGPARYQQLRASYGRIARALGVRGQERPG